VEEVREYLAGSFLEEAPIVPVSSRTMAGIEDLKSALSVLAADAEEKSVEGPFRLPVDRVFTMPGFGTVVTGTLLSGGIKTGDEVEILPSGITSRVRTVQTHGKKEEIGSAGQRLAINLQGVEHTAIARGDVVVPRGVFRTTRAIDARLTWLPTAPRELKHRSVLRLHSATYEVAAQIILLQGDTMKPGETQFAQLRLKNPVLLLPDDYFIVRTYSPQTTVGGGVVVDPAPPRRRRRSAEALELLSSLQDGEDSERIRLLAQQSLFSGITFEEIGIRSGLPAKRLDSALSGLLSQGVVVQMVREPRIFIGKDALDSLKSLLLGEIEGYLRNNPLKDGIGKEELRTRLPRRSDSRFFGPVLTALEKDGKATVERELVKLPGHKAAAVGDRAELQAKIEEAFIKGGFEPPTIKQLCDTFRCGEKEILELLNLLIRDGRIVKIKGDIHYAPLPLSQIGEKLVALLKEKKEITPPEFREVTGLSRKFMIPLLEYFDQKKVTIRVGDKRMLRKG
jgi:selenocysteine-specific elongation factor